MDFPEVLRGEQSDTELMAFVSSAPEPEIVGEIAVRRFGRGEPLLLIHGGSGSWTHWAAVIKVLKEEFEVTAIDLPGFGDAPNPEETEPGRYLDRTVKSIANAMDGSDFDLAGFSFGATIAAATARHVGRRVRKLSLLGPGGFGNPVGRTVAPVKVPAPDVDAAGHATALAVNLGRFMLAREPDADSAVVALQSANIARLRYDSRELSFQDGIIADLAAIECPLQLIWGETDRLAYPSIDSRIERVRTVRADAIVKVIPGAGHWVQFDAAARVAQLLIKFHR